MNGQAPTQVVQLTARPHGVRVLLRRYACGAYTGPQDRRIYAPLVKQAFGWRSSSYGRGSHIENGDVVEVKE
jgi:hypothetical protein